MGHGDRAAILSSELPQGRARLLRAISRLPRSENNRHKARCVAPVHVVAADAGDE